MQHQSKKTQKLPFTIRIPGKKDAVRALEYIRAVTGETEFLDLSPGDITFSLKEEKGYIKKMTTGSNSMLHVHKENHRAIQLYKKFGFVQEGTLRMDRYTGGSYHSTVVMGLILGKEDL